MEIGYTLSLILIVDTTLTSTLGGVDHSYNISLAVAPCRLISLGDHDICDIIIIEI